MAKEGNFQSPQWKKFNLIKAEYDTIGFISPKFLSIEFKPNDGLVDYQKLKNFASKNTVALISPAGSGKTTLIIKLMEEICQKFGYQPIFLPLADFTDDETIDDFINRNIPSKMSATDIFDGKHFIAWDGLNESPRADISEICGSLRKKQALAPIAFLLSCRPDEYPPAMRVSLDGVRLTEVLIEPLDKTKVKHNLIRLFEVTDREIEANDREAIDRISELCRVPLFYSMVQSTINDVAKIARMELINKFLSVRNSTGVYREFIDQTLIREQSKALFQKNQEQYTPAMREFVLGRLGYEMQVDDQVYWKSAGFEASIRIILNDEIFKRLFPDLKESTWQNFVTELQRKPPVRTVPSGRDLKKIAFLHQSVGEYFAALRIRHAYRDNEDWKGLLSSLMLPENRRNWSTVQFSAGFSSMHVQILEHIADFAISTKRQDLLILAARCVDGQLEVPDNILVEDLQIRMMEAFKNWGKPFDYDLVHELGDLGTRGAQRPRTQRISVDIGRFVAKYSEFRPTMLIGFTSDELLNILDGDNDIDAACAIYTLGVSKMAFTTAEIDRVCKVYEKRAWLVKEQIVVALKEVCAVEATDFLADIVDKPTTKSSTRTQVFALNAIAIIGDLEKISNVADYLQDSNRPFRDSAAWSLQKLALKAQSTGNHDKVRQIKQILYDVLETEKQTSEWKYIVGDILYSFGVLKAEDYLDKIIEWGKSANEPYVLEDLIYAIGLIGDATKSEFVAGYIDNEDPAVRLKAIEAIGMLKAIDYHEHIRNCFDDEFPFVRLIAETTNKLLINQNTVMSTHA